MGVMRTMGIEGDVKLEWNPENKQETEAAEKTFKENIKKGFKAFRMFDDGKKGSPLTDFDKFAEKILFVTPMQGG